MASRGMNYLFIDGECHGEMLTVQGEDTSIEVTFVDENNRRTTYAYRRHVFRFGDHERVFYATRNTGTLTARKMLKEFLLEQWVRDGR